MGNTVAKQAGKMCSLEDSRSAKTTKTQSTRWSAIHQHRVARSDYGEYNRTTTMDLPQLYYDDQRKARKLNVHNKRIMKHNKNVVKRVQQELNRDFYQQYLAYCQSLNRTPDQMTPDELKLAVQTGEFNLQTQIPMTIQEYYEHLKDISEKRRDSQLQQFQQQSSRNDQQNIDEPFDEFKKTSQNLTRNPQNDSPQKQFEPNSESNNPVNNPINQHHQFTKPHTGTSSQTPVVPSDFNDFLDGPTTLVESSSPYIAPRNFSHQTPRSIRRNGGQAMQASIPEARKIQTFKNNQNLNNFESEEDDGLADVTTQSGEYNFLPAITVVDNVDAQNFDARNYDQDFNPEDEAGGEYFFSKSLPEKAVRFDNNSPRRRIISAVRSNSTSNGETAGPISGLLEKMESRDEKVTLGTVTGSLRRKVKTQDRGREAFEIEPETRAKMKQRSLRRKNNKLESRSGSKLESKNDSETGGKHGSEADSMKSGRFASARNLENAKNLETTKTLKPSSSENSLYHPSDQHLKSTHTTSTKINPTQIKTHIRSNRASRRKIKKLTEKKGFDKAFKAGVSIKLFDTIFSKKGGKSSDDSDSSKSDEYSDETEGGEDFIDDLLDDEEDCKYVAYMLGLVDSEDDDDDIDSLSNNGLFGSRQGGRRGSSQMGASDYGGHCGSSQGNHGNKAGDGNGDIDPFDCDSNLFIIDGDNDGLGNYFEEEEDILMEEMDEQYDEEYYYMEHYGGGDDLFAGNGSNTDDSTV